MFCGHIQRNGISYYSALFNSGYVSDTFQKKKALAYTGYATGILYKLALVFAGSWIGILSAGVLDRFGKGIRTAPRDVMVAESADKASMGRA